MVNCSQKSGNGIWRQTSNAGEVNEDVPLGDESANLIEEFYCFRRIVNQ